MNPRPLAEAVARQFVMDGTIERDVWREVADAIAAAIREDRARLPRQEEDTLP